MPSGEDLLPGSNGNPRVNKRQRQSAFDMGGRSAYQVAITRKVNTMPQLVYVLNGPNLNLLGQRQPEIYGSETLGDVEKFCASLGTELGLSVRCLQSNHEGQIVDWIQEARGQTCGIIINPGAYSHTSVAILDALTAFEGLVMEVHISNIHARDSFRHHSYVSQRAEAVIAGCGTDGYSFALRRIARLLGKS